MHIICTNICSNLLSFIVINCDIAHLPGAKHQVRALLAVAGGAPISGDLRYGCNNRNTQFNHAAECGRVDQPLLDGSVALHARSVSLPTVSLGGMEFLKDEPFVGSIPSRWRDFFGISENDVRKISF